LLKRILQGTVSAVSYLMFVGLVAVFFDTVVFKQWLGYGYPRHYEEEDVGRYPAPYVMFTGKPNTLGNNELGFRHASFRESKPDDFKIAFFAGSTGYLGDPPIPKVVEQELNKTWDQHVFVANFSVISSNHRQHLHGILEYLPSHKPDLVVFYGGYNELTGARSYDPRPGYPYNFFYRSETGPLTKLLLEHSALAGEFDMRFGLLSGISKLRDLYKPGTPEWNRAMEDKYFETLELSSKTASTIESAHCGHARFLAFYQPFQLNASFAAMQADVRKRIAALPYGVDVSTEFDALGSDVYFDEVHVHQPANDAMGRKIAATIADQLRHTNLCSPRSVNPA